VEEGMTLHLRFTFQQKVRPFLLIQKVIPLSKQPTFLLKAEAQR